jgi:uncharacterized protein (DUF849 family)
VYENWLEDGVLPGKAYPLLFVIGKKMVVPGFDETFLRSGFIQDLRASSWMVCAFGKNEYAMGKLAVSLGGNIRIGFENNCFLADESIASSNADLITQMANDLAQNNHQIANYKQAYQIMKPDW